MIRDLAGVGVLSALLFLACEDRRETEPSDPADCLARREVMEYQQQIRARMYARWMAPAEAPEDSVARIRFALDPDGSVVSAEMIAGTHDSALDESAIAALRSASPFGPMPERVRCLAGRRLVGTFSLPRAN